MKTPHRMTLLRGENIHGRYNPETDNYDYGIINRTVVPCFVSVPNHAKVFEAYGTRDIRVISCRFMQPQAPFRQAEFQGKVYEPLEVLIGPVKGAIRLKEVAGGRQG